MSSQNALIISIRVTEMTLIIIMPSTGDAATTLTDKPNNSYIGLYKASKEDIFNYPAAKQYIILLFRMIVYIQEAISQICHDIEVSKT